MLKHIYQRVINEKTRLLLHFAFYKITAFMYSCGSKYQCNICTKSFGRFRSHGIIRRNNVKCPYCLSLERTRLLWFYLIRELKIKKNNYTILHVAPEAGISKKLKEINKSSYYSIDINPLNADIKMDLTNLNFPDNFFDIIICAHVLGHIPDEDKAIKEMFRVLKKTGKTLILTVMGNGKTLENNNITSTKERIKKYGEPDLVRLHGSNFNEKLRNHGFKVNIVDYRYTLGHEICQQYSLGDGKRELIFKCQKINNFL